MNKLTFIIILILLITGCTIRNIYDTKYDSKNDNQSGTHEVVIKENYSDLNIKLLIDESVNNDNSGLILISSNSNFRDYASEIATLKDWSLAVTDSLIEEEIRKEIINYYNQKSFHYLLIINNGTNIPISTSYSDVDNDAFAEVSLGFLPFDNESELIKYFTDLEIKGSNYYFEFYPFNNNFDDSSYYVDYNYMKSLSYSEYIQVNRGTDINTLIIRVKNASFIQIESHGGKDGLVINQDSFYIGSLDDSFLENRPVIVNSACLTASGLGISLIKQGASAFIGFAREEHGQMNPYVFSDLMTGKSIGDSFKELLNAYLLHFVTDNSTVIFNFLTERSNMNNYEISDYNKPVNADGLILYGDPSIKLSGFKHYNSSIKINQESDKIVINVNPGKLVSLDNGYYFIVYDSNSIYEQSLVNHPGHLNESHRFKIILPVTGVNEITDVTINDNTLITNIYNSYLKANLIKSINESFISLFIATQGMEFNTPTQIVINYK